MWRKHKNDIISNNGMNLPNVGLYHQKHQSCLKTQQRFIMMN